MRLFGRRANQQSATEVPPELQQYYGTPTVGTRFRRASLFVLPIVAFLVVLGLVLGGAVWMRHHRLSDLPQVISRQSSKSPAKSEPSSPSTPTTTQPGENSQPTDQNAQPAQSGVGASGQQVAGNTSQSSTPASSQAPIPNTGPNGSVLVFSAATALISAAAFHLRQVRRASPER